MARAARVMTMVTNRAMATATKRAKAARAMATVMKRAMAMAVRVIAMATKTGKQRRQEG
jgi:hypothetical protein